MKRFAAILAVALSLLAVSVAFAQGELSLTISRDFGYGGFDNRIQGNFSLRVDGPENLTAVDYYVDDDLLGSESEPPFRHQFSTGAFAPGEHTLYAIGHTSDGLELRSNELLRVFITPDEVRQAMTSGVLPVVGIILAIAAVATLLLLLLSRGKQRFELGQYGLAGGAVCKQCDLPFSRHVWMPNLLLGKLERCPHCGKLAIVPRASASDLEAAEDHYRREEQGEDTTDSAQNEAERLRRQIDDSRYED